MSNPVAATTEDEELQRAIELSMLQSSQTIMDVDSGSTVSLLSAPAGSQNQPILVGEDDDKELVLALEKSLTETSAASSKNMNNYVVPILSSENPYYRKRDWDLPTVGLKNVGNTCYFNAAVQTYFGIDAIRKLVLTYPSDAVINELKAAANAAEPSSEPQVIDLEKQAEQQKQKVIQESVEFVTELQRLFSYMILTNQNHIDPSPVLNRMKDNDSNPAIVGNQEDVGEFNNLLLEKLEQGFDVLVPKSAAAGAAEEETSAEGNTDNKQHQHQHQHHPENVIAKLFYGHAVEIINAKEFDGSIIEKFNNNTFSHLMLSVSDKIGDLYDSLDQTLCSRVEYTTDKGHKTKAQKTQWFESIPPVLMFHLQRVSYDAAEKSFTKINLPLNFDQEIYLDRYFLSNRRDTEIKRKIVADLREQLANVNQELDKLIHYQGKSFGLYEAMESTLMHLHEMHDQMKNDQTRLSNNSNNNSSSPTPMATESSTTATGEAAVSSPTNAAGVISQSSISQAIKVVQHYSNICEKKMKELRAQQTDLQNQIKAAYNDRKQHRYALHAIWVHSGVAGSGHYWSYIRDHKKQKWYKLNDTIVSEVDEAEVMRESIGSAGSATNAYFLIYVDMDKCNSTVLNSQFKHVPRQVLERSDLEVIPDKIKQEVEKHNQKLTEDLEVYLYGAVGAKARSFKNIFNERLEQARSIMQSWNPDENDTILATNLYAFMLKTGLFDQSLAAAVLIKDIYYELFSKAIEDDLGSEAYNKVVKEFGEEPIANAITCLYQRQDEINKRKAEFKAHQEVAQDKYISLKLMLENRYIEAVRVFADALEKQRKSTNLFLNPSILIQYIWILFDDATRLYFTGENVLGAMQKFEICVSTAIWCTTERPVEGGAYQTSILEPDRIIPQMLQEFTSKIMSAQPPSSKMGLAIDNNTNTAMIICKTTMQAMLQQHHAQTTGSAAATSTGPITNFVPARDLVLTFDLDVAHREVANTVPFSTLPLRCLELQQQLHAKFNIHRMTSAELAGGSSAEQPSPLAQDFA